MVINDVTIDSFFFFAGQLHYSGGRLNTSLNLTIFNVFLQCVATTIMQNAGLYGFHTLLRIVAEPVAFHRACRYAEIASKKAITLRTISTCFCLKPVALAIAVTRLL